jgi:hypothetical protein
VIEQLHSIKE